MRIWIHSHDVTYNTPPRNRMMSTVSLSQVERDQLAESCNSVYLNRDSLDCALLAAGRHIPMTLSVCPYSR